MITTIDSAKARKQVERGKSWAAVAREMGVEVKSLRRRADPNFHESPRHRGTTGHHSNIYIRRNTADVDGAKLLADVQPDTRTAMERFMGVPPRGRSALDQRQAAPEVERTVRMPVLQFLREEA